MRHHLPIILVAFLAVFIQSCTPEDEPGEQIIGAPVFYVKGTVNGKPINIQAGVNRYYMTPLYETDTNGVLVFGAKLADTTCASCEALTIKVRNYSQDPNYHIDSSFYQGDYDFYNSTAGGNTYYDATFISQSKGNGTPTDNWLFGNGQSGKGDTKMVRYNDAGTYDVTLRSEFTGCEDEITLKVKVPSIYDDQYIDINTNITDDRTVLFNSIPVDANANVTWDFGDGETGQGTIISHTYAAPGVYKVCMMFEKGGNTVQHCIKVDTRTNASCVSNFRYKIKTISDPLQLSGVVVEWKDEDGKVYTSSSLNQKNMEFKVLERSEYIPASGSGKVVKVKVRFSCQVTDGVNTLNLNEVEATLAFSYP
jgi:hypothetical protein